jgi:alkanesulfonate monooxygenase SsuD/methylene tetrahydromethanopterin reductase-like flavin-dependent oxidoreductase (luciferase family)
VAKLGLFIDLRNPPGWHQDPHRLYSFTLELCEEAERLGADSAWLSEHHGFEDGYLTQPLSFATAVAARTTRLRIGTAVVIAPLREPALLAEEAAMVDIVSGGRLDLGLGAGYRLPEYELYGKEMKGRYDALDDTVRQMRTLWRDGRVPPAPVQDPVPIWMGYQGPKGARRAGLLGEHLLSAQRSLLEPYQSGLVEGGHDPAIAKMASMVPVFATEDPERDWPTVAQHLQYQVDSYLSYGVEGTGNPPPPPLDTEKARTRGLGKGLSGIVCDTPDVVAAQINEHLGGLPVDTVFMFASVAGMPEAMVVEHTRVLCEQVRPLIADL